MRYSWLLALPIIVSGSVAYGNDDKLSESEKVSYSIGVRTAENFQAQEINIDVVSFVEGLTDAYNKNQPKLSEEEMHEVLANFQEAQMAKLQEKEQEIAKENLIKSNDFLAENKNKPGVVTLKSGLQYKVITEGKGASPTDKDYVTVNYRGTLTNGVEFDSSYRRNQATTFQLSNLIPGWQEGIKLMKPGAKWQLFVPPQLAYGERGAGSTIQPNSALIFDVELVEIKNKN